MMDINEMDSVDVAKYVVDRVEELQNSRIYWNERYLKSDEEIYNLKEKLKEKDQEIAILAGKVENNQTISLGRSSLLNMLRHAYLCGVNTHRRLLLDDEDRFEAERDECLNELIDEHIEVGYTCYSDYDCECNDRG